MILCRDTKKSCILSKKHHLISRNAIMNHISDMFLWIFRFILSRGETRKQMILRGFKKRPLSVINKILKNRDSRYERSSWRGLRRFIVKIISSDLIKLPLTLMPSQVFSVDLKHVALWLHLLASNLSRYLSNIFPEANFL